MLIMKKQSFIMILILVPMVVLAQSTYQENIKAAKKGDAEAQFRIGSCYSKGWDVKINDEQAVFWWLKAAKQGHVISQHLVAFAYDRGKGVKKDTSQAVYWYRKAAEQGYCLSQECLGLFYMKKENRDYNQAAFWFRKAAEQGDAISQFWMGYFCFYGFGVGKDYVKASNWFRKSAEQGEANAQLRLGGCYYDGTGVSKDYSQAVYWMQKSLDNGNLKAKDYLALAKKKMQEQEAESVLRNQIADSIAKVYEAYENPEWKSKAKIDQHYSTLLYESDFPYTSFEEYDESTRFLVRCNKRIETAIGHYPIKIKVQGGGRSNIADLNNCFVKFNEFQTYIYY